MISIHVLGFVAALGGTASLGAIVGMIVMTLAVAAGRDER